VPTKAVKVKGLRELHRALKKYDSDLKPELESRLLDAGRIVQDEARNLFSVIDTRSAMGFRARLKGFGRVVVEQRRRKTTGQHPEFGSLQMRRALIPAVSDSETKVMNEMEDLLDDLWRRF
jgi:hypothetical protein